MSARTMNGPAMGDYLRIIEECRWHPCADGLPDADTIVLISCVDGNEPVWFGYHDGAGWRTVEGAKVKVNAWRDLPAAFEGGKP